VILVAHRARLLVHADKVLVLHDGIGVLFGPRNRVLARLAVPDAAARRAVAAAS
jgi:ABC-type protease/lipase transport system fused ATPase/permease subunit